MRIIDYHLIKSERPYDLQSKVLQKMKEGWVPLGGASVGGASQNNQPRIYSLQTMVKYAKD